MRCSRPPAWLALCACLVACSQVVDFDRDVLRGRDVDSVSAPDAAAVDASASDASAADASAPDASRQERRDGSVGGQVEAGVGRPDSGGQGQGADAAAGACDPSTHAGCGPDELCCDGSCVAAAANAGCEACGRACGDEASVCRGRKCVCGNGPACSGPVPLCVAEGEGAAARCVECVGPTDCEGRADGRTQCVNHACVACNPAQGNAGCENPTPICDPGSRSCVGCSSRLPCEAGLTCASGRCLGCNEQTNAGCDARGTTPICEPTGDGQSECVGCSSDADCRNNPGGGQCVGGACRSCDPGDNAGCSGDQSVCDRSTFACRGCYLASECKAPYCTALQLLGVPLAPGKCVECLQPSHCGAGRVCEFFSNTCQDCTAAGNNAFARDQACQFAYPGWLPVCDAASRRCVRCSSDAHCGGNTPICDARSKQCVGCRSDAECGARSPQAPVCLPWGGCVQCSADNKRACGGSAPNCDVNTGTCVGCTGDASCGGSTPLCMGGRCVDCTQAGGQRDVARADAACARKAAAAPWCIWEGVHRGECGACAPGREWSCDRGICVEETLECVHACDPATHAGCNPTGDRPTFCIDVGGGSLSCEECGPEQPCAGGRACESFKCVGTATALAPPTH